MSNSDDGEADEPEQQRVGNMNAGQRFYQYINRRINALNAIMDAHRNEIPEEFDDEQREDERMESLLIADHENGRISYSPARTPPTDEHEDNLIAEALDSGTYANLATAHSYLGKMEDVSGYTYYDDGQILTSMPGIFTNTLVFPGYVLPLKMIFLDHEREEANKVTNGFTFVLLTYSESKKYKFGVILEVFQASVEDNVITIKAKGRERCIVDYYPTTVRMWGRFHRVNVKVLVEPTIHSMINSSQLLSLRKFRGNSIDASPESKFYKYRRLHLLQYPLPSWVYDHNELTFYVKHIVSYLTEFYNTKNIPTVPEALSYWFAQNFQLNHNERLRLLSCNSTLERLKVELKLLRTQRVMRCKYCRLDIALQKDVFCLSKYGMQSNYVNPNGNVFEAITVLSAKNFDLSGRPSKQFTWFPGYAWTVMQCKCMQHLGWKFTTTNKRFSPTSFFAIANENVTMSDIRDPLTNESDEEVFRQ